MKAALVRPLIKSNDLDPDLLKSYRPVSNLPFISKILEKVVSSRIDEHLLATKLIDQDQTAYRKFNSTETALMCIHNDILRNMDKGRATLLLMLDLSAAYDTIDHDIFLFRLTNYFGISGTAKKWFESYLTGRKSQVVISQNLSTEMQIECGAAQGSVLGGKCYNMYTTPLREIFKAAHNVCRKAYADDNQAYVSFEIDCEHEQGMSTAISNLMQCLETAQKWMDHNMLQWNGSKTEMILFSPKKHIARFKDFSLRFGNSVILNSSVVENLGVYLDSSLSMQRHINEKTRSAHHQVRNLWTIRKYLTEQAAIILVNSLVMPKFDYCNSLLYGVKQSLLHKLQRAQNSAVRLIKKVKKRQHITPYMKQLHWLPIKYRIQFKILLITFKTFHGKAPQYINCLLSELRSTRFDNKKLSIPTVKLKRTGTRAFSYAAPFLWNSLPLHIRESASVEIFKKRLKTFYFRLHYVPNETDLA